MNKIKISEIYDDFVKEIDDLRCENSSLNYKLSKKETQQKEFIKYLEDEIKRINPDSLSISELINSELDNIKFTQFLIYKEILQKYKEITEKIDNE